MRIILILLVIAIPSIAFAADWKKVQGIYAVTAEHYIDPSDDEPKDSHYRIQLKGKSAKDLYRAMKVEPVKDECTDALAKNIGDMQCLYFKGETTYECHFSINLAKQKIEYGVAC